MPRVKTTPKVAVKKRPYMNTYDEKSMEQAVRAVKEKLKSMRGAAKQYGVPLATLQNKVSGELNYIDNLTN